MTRSGDPRAQRTHDLLADRALFGLDDAEARELRELGADADDSYDLAAAAVDLATLPIEPMPAAVAERIAAARHPRTLAGWIMPGAPTTEAPAEPIGSDVPGGQVAPAGRAVPTAPAPITRLRPRRRTAVVLLSAASLALVAGAWWLLRSRPAPTAAQARTDLLATAADASRLTWHPTPEATGASGDVVWSPSTQRGFMRFVGLPPNDPTKTQYQLWIFDRQRDQAYPVDGGVFDVASTGEVIVPITAKLWVGDAALFAVTVERPGGVVVSRREHIVVTAGG
jgi:anti-sigma-K factor RskA